MDTCQNCNSKLKVGVLGTNQLLMEGAVKIINSLDDQNAECYCNKCGDKLLTNATAQLKSKIGKLNEGLLLLSQHIPILSTHSPLNWDYDSIGIITGQSTTGTGVISDFTSGITDFFGAQSGAYNTKLAEGENKCFDQFSCYIKYPYGELPSNWYLVTDSGHRIEGIGISGVELKFMGIYFIGNIYTDGTIISVRG